MLGSFTKVPLDNPPFHADNMHPADLQQMNFQKMAEEATQKEEDETFLDVEDV